MGLAYLLRRGSEEGLSMALRFLPRACADGLSLFFRNSPFWWGYAVRQACLRRLCKTVGKGVSVAPGSIVTDHGELAIGSGVSINEYCFLSARGGLRIGDNVSIGHRVSVLSSEHRFDVKGVPIRESGLLLKPTVIEDDVWIGAGVIILAGVVVRRGSVIAAAACVTKDVPAGAVAGGVPARVLRMRFQDEGANAG